MNDIINANDCVTILAKATDTDCRGSHIARVHVNTEALPENLALEYDGHTLTVRECNNGLKPEETPFLLYGNRRQGDVF